MSDTFRRTYRELTDAEKEHVEQIKDAATRLEKLFKDVLYNAQTDSFTEGKHREHRVGIALMNLEQAVMWAVKAAT